MERIGIQIITSRNLRNFPQVHHGDPVADVPDYSQVMGDK
jgi:hypothetical protein